MALFDVFKKKECAICGGEIGLLGNRKLEDGNMCKHCAAKLSPWFSDRRNSTIAQIQEQLAYREENRKAVAAFRCSLSIGDNTKFMQDEAAGKFMIASSRNLEQENPDVIDVSAVTGVRIDIDESSDEEKRRNTDNEWVSYNPPRYLWRYDFYVEISVNHPYFDKIRFRLNDSDVGSDVALPISRKPNPENIFAYHQYKQMAEEIKAALLAAKSQAKEASGPRTAVTCPRCGATTIPDANGCCEYCMGAVN